MGRIFGRIFLEEFLWRNFREQFFWESWEDFFGENFFGRNFWGGFFREEFFVQIVKVSYLNMKGIDLFVNILVFVKILSLGRRTRFRS